MAKRTLNRKQKRTLRLIVAFLFFALCYFLTENKTVGKIEENVPPVILCNQCNDDLEGTLLSSIDEAQKSIHLVIYSLTDTPIIDALNEKAIEGKSVTILHDQCTKEKELSSKIKKVMLKPRGLMHQKILVIDGEKIWIGSANFTKESLHLHENLIIGIQSQLLANRILGLNREHRFLIGGQVVEFWDLPEEGRFALPHVISLLDKAQESIQIAMYTWTHQDLTEAILRAHKRGIKVTVLLDRTQSHWVNKKTLEQLNRAGIETKVNLGGHLLHHKFALIDGKVLICGSANWTPPAFTKNDDCLLILYDLTETQQNKINEIWRRAAALSEKPIAH